MKNLSILFFLFLSFLFASCQQKMSDALQKNEVVKKETKSFSQLDKYEQLYRLSLERLAAEGVKVKVIERGFGPVDDEAQIIILSDETFSFTLRDFHKEYRLSKPDEYVRSLEPMPTFWLGSKNLKLADTSLVPISMSFLLNGGTLSLLINGEKTGVYIMPVDP